MKGTFELRDGEDGVRMLTLHNPKKRNALDAHALEELHQALDTPPTIRALLIASTGEVFSAGFDIAALEAGIALPDARLEAVLDALAEHPLPSVACVQGAAIGAGCELALACDFRIGGPRAGFRMPPAQLGVIYSLHGLERIVARSSERFARWMLLNGDLVDAQAALREGLLDRLVDEPVSVAAELAATLASRAPLAVAGLKQGLRHVRRGHFNEPTREDFDAKRRQAFASEDLKEGLAAFKEKRRAKFRGK